MREMLFEAALVLMTHSRKWSWLKAWGMKIARHRGMKRAIVAVARRLAVIMHRMWSASLDQGRSCGHMTSRWRLRIAGSTDDCSAGALTPRPSKRERPCRQYTVVTLKYLTPSCA
jgi:hypothetical protein